MPSLFRLYMINAQKNIDIMGEKKIRKIQQIFINFAIGNYKYVHISKPMLNKYRLKICYLGKNIFNISSKRETQIKINYFDHISQ